jgi:hypothetical protein
MTGNRRASLISISLNIERAKILDSGVRMINSGENKDRYPFNHLKKNNAEKVKNAILSKVHI